MNKYRPKKNQMKQPDRAQLMTAVIKFRDRIEAERKRSTISATLLARPQIYSALSDLFNLIWEGNDETAARHK